MSDPLGTLGARIYWCRNVLLADPEQEDHELMFQRVRMGAMPTSSHQIAGAPTQAEFGERLAARLGKSEPIPAGTISRWEADKAVPDLGTIFAIARLCRAAPGWLAFGAESGAPSPYEALPKGRQFYAKVVAETRARQVVRNEEAEADKAALAKALRRPTRSRKPEK